MTKCGVSHGGTAEAQIHEPFRLGLAKLSWEPSGPLCSAIHYSVALFCVWGPPATLFTDYSLLLVFFENSSSVKKKS